MTFNPTGVQVAGVIVSLLAGSGALGFFFKYGVRLALVERTAREAAEDSKQNGKDIAATKERVSLVESTLQAIAHSLSKLDSIDEIRANVSGLTITVTERFKAQDERMNALKEQITELREDLNK